MVNFSLFSHPLVFMVHCYASSTIPRRSPLEGWPTILEAHISAISFILQLLVSSRAYSIKWRCLRHHLGVKIPIRVICVLYTASLLTDLNSRFLALSLILIGLFLTRTFKDEHSFRQMPSSRAFWFFFMLVHWRSSLRAVTRKPYSTSNWSFIMHLGMADALWYVLDSIPFDLYRFNCLF